ncbi:MAG TPA: hypothetical protein VNF29_13500 [Candidatus Binataceae bacterium]|nr:hypothetical protein [Candidatus Binataceae bacterium]
MAATSDLKVRAPNLAGLALPGLFRDELFSLVIFFWMRRIDRVADETTSRGAAVRESHRAAGRSRIGQDPDLRRRSRNQSEVRYFGKNTTDLLDIFS